MQLNPSEISELLKKRIEGLGVSADLRTSGHGGFVVRRHCPHSWSERRDAG